MNNKSTLPFKKWWLKWRFHLNILLVLIPLGLMPGYLKDAALFRGDTGLGEREIGLVKVGPWSITLAELRDDIPQQDGPAGYLKSINAALCLACKDQVKAIYLRLGKPRNIRTAGHIFFGSPYRMGTSISIPEKTQSDALVWITMEGWDGSLHQASLPLTQVSPKTVAWLEKRGTAK